ncbi:MAG: hypothetical protein ACRDF5_10400 [bacterium]
MSSKLHLGVRKYLLGDTVATTDPRQPSGVLAEITPLAGSEEKTIRRLVPIGPHGRTELIDVPAGRLAIQVRLPSGEILNRDIVLPDGQESTVVLETRSSPHEWMSWPRFLSKAAQTAPEPEGVGYRIRDLHPALWVRRQNGTIELRPGPLWHEDVDAGRRLVSYTFTGSVAGWGERPFLTIDPAPPSSTMLATIPLPWSREGQVPRVQVVIRLAKGEERDDVDVLVHDPWLAPMLGYLESGDLAAARQFEASVLENAEDLLSEKAMNPIAAAAGAYLLLQTRALQRLHDWPRNLAARFDWLPDGAIIYATQMLRTRDRNKKAIREALLSAAKRGAPVFVEGVQLLGDGLRVLANYEATGSEAPGQYRRRRADEQFEALSEWVAALESATRPDTLFTILEAEDATLRSLIAGFSL